jgi:hypothetical protein
MNPATFFRSKHQRSAARSSAPRDLARFCFLFAGCAVAAYAVGGCASGGKLAARTPYTGVKMGASVFDARNRNFEKPWPFGDAPGPGENFN